MFPILLISIVIILLIYLMNKKLHALIIIYPLLITHSYPSALFHIENCFDSVSSAEILGKKIVCIFNQCCRAGAV
jgi:hypothetical protein